MKHWTARQIEILAGLRTRFLSGTAGDCDYWHSEEELALYDSTFAQRIGWKIDAVIRGLTSIGWHPRSRRVVDWGCGTGIATRCLLEVWPEFEGVSFFDRSPLAVRFARARALEKKASLQIGEPSIDKDTLLMISHVANELSAKDGDRLLELISQAGEVLWIEAGTYSDSRRLIEFRARILDQGTRTRVVAPCTHQAGCGMTLPNNAQHWCHHFAEAPPAIFQDARWAELSRKLGINLRVLPYSYLVLSRHEVSLPKGCTRIIGHPRVAKGYCRVLSCAEEGVDDLMLQKRDAPEFFRALTKSCEWPPQRWKSDGVKIVEMRPLAV